MEADGRPKGPCFHRQLGENHTGKKESDEAGEDTDGVIQRFQEKTDMVPAGKDVCPVKLHFFYWFNKIVESEKVNQRKYKTRHQDGFIAGNALG